MAEAKDILKDMPWVKNPGGVGRIVRIVGAIVDVEFAPADMPGIYNALIVDGETAIGHVHNVLEVQ